MRAWLVLCVPLSLLTACVGDPIPPSRSPADPTSPSGQEASFALPANSLAGAADGGAPAQEAAPPAHDHSHHQHHQHPGNGS